MTRQSQRPAQLGALRVWWRELAASLRTPTDFDALFRGAAKEAEADDLERAGCPTGASNARREAAEVIVAAAKAKRPERAA